MWKPQLSKIRSSVVLLPAQGAAAVTKAQTNRWIQLVAGVVCMMAVSSPQYVWTLFTKPLVGEPGTTMAQLQVTFSRLIVLQTFFSPFQGALVDRFGPRLLLSIGALLTGASSQSMPERDRLTRELLHSHRCASAHVDVAVERWR